MLEALKKKFNDYSTNESANMTIYVKLGDQLKNNKAD